MMETPSFEQAVQALQNHFGYPAFRPGQDEIIRSVLERKHTVAVMPTGGGKSICYQIPATLFSGLTLVVSPLISLMQDQVEALERVRIRATFINSMLDYREVMNRIEKARNGWYKLLYVAPERFESRMFLEQIKRMPISLFAIDEAHCISEWGHDFRPSYLKLRETLELLGMPQVVALTATATPDVRKDIQVQLGLRDPELIVRGFNRENLTFRVSTGSNKRDEIFRLSSTGETGIVYAGTRRTVEELAESLRHHGVSAEAYHAGLDDGRRRGIQQQFMNGDFRVIVATTAFGMGIDKRDVRFVIHHDMPGTVEQYYQEAGRAGRDGLESTCTILHHPSDRQLPEFFIRNTFPDRALIQKVYAQLHHSAGTQPGQTYTDLLKLTASSLAAIMGKVSEASVRGALDILEHDGYIRRIRESYSEATIEFLLSPDRFRDWMVDSATVTLQPIAVALLRTVGAEAFHRPSALYIDEMAQKTFFSEEDLLNGLGELHKQRIIRFTPGRKGSGIALLGARIQARDLEIDYSRVEQRMRHQLEKLLAMEHYILGKACRRNMLLEYFQETDIEGSCGKCDTCTSTVIDTGESPEQDIFERYAQTILHCVAETGGRFGRITVVDILRGARTKRIAQYRLYEISTYGKARSVDKSLLIDAVDSMIGMGWMAKTDNQYPSVYVTEIGRKKLDADVRPVTLPRPGTDADVSIDDRVLYQALKAVRRRVAAELNLPSHFLVPETVLQAMANEKPTTKEACLTVEGMGPVTWEKCGAQLLAAVQQHERENRLAGAVYDSQQVLSDLPATMRSTFEYVVAHKSIEEIARLQNLTEGTVSRHISEMILKGVSLDIASLLPKQQQKQIRKAIAILKSNDMKKIKAMVDEGISYAAIRIMLAVIAKEKKD